jgi:hypothetical protein
MNLRPLIHIPVDIQQMHTHKHTRQAQTHTHKHTPPSTLSLPVLNASCSLWVLDGYVWTSGVKCWSKNTLKYYLSSFLGVFVLYFTIIFLTTFTFTSLHSLRKLCTFYIIWHSKVLVTISMLSSTGHWSNSHTYQENVAGPPYCLTSGGLTIHKCFLCKWCLSLGVCPWLS